MKNKIPMTVVVAISVLMALLGAGSASAAEAPISQLDRYFGHTKDIETSVPATQDAINVVQLRIKAPQNIRSPGLARFVIDGDRYLDYHYAGYNEGTHTYLVGAPKAYSGSVTIGAYIDNRIPLDNSYSRSRDDLVRNTVVLGANDIVLLVDVSGSMGAYVTGGTRMTLAQNVVNTISPQLESEGNNVAVIEYNSSARTRLGLDTKYSYLSFNAGGGTGTSSAISLARQMLNGRPSPGKIIISITDGVPNNATATRNQVEAVDAAKDQGWAIAGIGMGMQLPTYYPIRQFVSNTASDLGLQGAILNMVKTAEEQVRDVNSVCSGNKCETEDNDNLPPRFDVKIASECGTPKDGDDFEFIYLDAGEAGINMGSIGLSVDFGDVEVPLKARIENQADINDANATGVPPKKVVYRADGNMDDTTLRTLFTRANFKAEDEGGRLPYTFKLSASDLDGNSRAVEEVIDPVVDEDKKAPSISIHAGPNNGDGNIMRHMADLSISITDDKTGVDPGYVDFSFNYKGEVYPFRLSANEVGDISDDHCVARKPVSLVYDTSNIIADNSLTPVLMDMMVDAFKTGDPLTLKVETEDFAKNAVVETREIRFIPELVEKNAMRIPGINHQFNTQTNGPGLLIDAEELAFELGEVTTYYMRLLNDTDLPLTVNGIAVDSTAPVRLGNFPLEADFDIGLDIASAQNGVEGDSTLVLVPSDQFSRMVHVPLNIWQSDTALESDLWDPVQLLEVATADAVQNDGFACGLTGVRQIARGSDPINNPICLVEWLELPTDTYGTLQHKPYMAGRIPQPGEKLVSYRVLLFDTDGTQFVVDSGEASFNVIPAKDVMSFSLGDRLDGTYRIVREITGELEQTAGPSCNGLTTDSEYAYDRSALGSPKCLITWDKLPEGLTKGLYGATTPSFYGPFWLSEGDSHFEWTVSSFSTSGEPVELMKGEQTVPLQDPPDPIVTMDEKNHLEGDLYWGPKMGGYIGDYMLETINAPLTVHLNRNGELIDEERTFPSSSDTSYHRSRLMTSATNIWEYSNYEVHGFFKDLPEVGAKKSIRVLSVPSEEIRPDISVNSEVILNTEQLVVDTQMMDPFNREDGYNPDDMGLWDIRLLNYMSYSQQEPMTEYLSAGADGAEQFVVDLKGAESTFIRILPQARLISPVEDYSREVIGSRPVYITLLRGEAIESSIDARRLVGEAPLNIVAGLALDNRLDYQALGEIKWQVREMGQSAWSEMPEQRMVGRLYHSFEAGDYELRAKVQNNNSGAVFTTEIVEVQAYEIPEITVEGPTNAFIGDTANLSVKAVLNGEEIPVDQLDIRWSEDDGETWSEGGANYDVTRNEEARLSMAVKVRMLSSPAGFEDAIEEENFRLSFQPIRPPRVGIYGDRVIESGNPVKWRGMVREPYTNMDVIVKGEFILPDGSVVPSQLVEYTATDQDAEQERVEVKFRAWVEGFRDQGAEALDTRRILVWEYEWPAWDFYTRMSATQAPADISLRLRSPSGSIRYLEELDMEWHMPAGVQVLESDRDDSRVIRVEEAGVYPIEVTVSDGRGYVSEMVNEIVIHEADPWNVGFRLSKSNDLDRAPLELRFIPDVGGGHPRDRLEVHRYYLNGALISEGERYASMTLAAGTYDLGLEIESMFGEIVRHTESLKVLPNIPPECTLGARKSGVNWRFAAECGDEDGRVNEHVWTVDGEQLAMSGSRISVSVRETGQLSVSVKAIDNGGAESSVETWSGMAQAPEDRNDRDDRDDRRDEPEAPKGENPSGPLTPNEPPVCSMDQRKWGSGMRFSVDCEDPDGRMANYRWTVNGQELSVSDTRVEVDAEEGAEVSVSFKGVDDRGATSATQSWSGIVNPVEDNNASDEDASQGDESSPEEGPSSPPADSKPPVCSLEQRKWGSAMRFSADCEDPDGRMANYLWAVNGETVDVSDSRLYVEVKATQVVTVTLQGVDGDGGKSAVKSWEGEITPK